MNKKVRHYSDAEKYQILTEWMDSGESMETFQVKYGMGHCTISRWMCKFGLSKTSNDRFHEMKDKLEKRLDKTVNESALEAKIAMLEKELESERLKSLTYKTMIEVAESDLGIEIRKKSGAK